MEKLVLKRVARFLQALFSARKWQRIWSKDWVLKFISLVLATLLWYFVGGEDIVDKNVMVPIEIINLPRDLVISNQFKKEIEVTVSGPRSVIQDMSNKAVTRQVNLSNATPGTNVIENDNSSIPVPRGITVLRIQPSSIILTLDKLIQKQFPVTPVTSGDVAVGFEMVKMVMNPDVISITGPETILAQAKALMTDVISLKNMKESKQVQVPLDLEPSFVDLIGETSVTADITVKPKMVEKKVSRVEVEVEASVDGQIPEVAPKTVDVILKIPVLLLREERDLKKLFTVTATDSGDNGEFLKVTVVPSKENSLPLEVVSIIPSAVKLVRNPGVGAGKPAAAESENETAKEPKREKPVDVKAAAVVQDPEQLAITARETSGKDASEVKILPAKKKKIIQKER